MEGSAVVKKQRSWGKKLVLIAATGAIAVAAIGWTQRSTIAVWVGLREKPTQCDEELSVTELKMVVCTPAEQSGNHKTTDPILAEVLLSDTKLDPSTVSSKTVTLIRVHDLAKMETDVSVEADGKTILVTPRKKLDPQTNYSMYLTSGIKDTSGITIAPFQMSFDTAADSPQKLPRFEQVKLPDTTGLGITCLTVAPDGKLWAAVDDGRILRWPINTDGTIGPRQEIRSLVDFYKGQPRLIGGFCFDPSTTIDNPIIWVTHTKFGFINMPDWQGKVSRMSGKNLENVEEIVVNLPRSARDHIIHQPSFGPDGALYFQSGSMSSYGDPDGYWGNRKEHPFAAAVVRIDTHRLPSRLPIDVKTPEDGGTYPWREPSVPVQVWAYGIRVVYDLNWHSNGYLYAPTNGSSAGGNAPASDHCIAIKKVPDAEHDWLFKVEKGGYYGHPNPSQGYYVVNGGNPTSEGDFAEVTHYPVGTNPEKDWKPAVYDFGNHVSANGAMEYYQAGALQNALVVCRYNMGSDLIALKFDEKGNVNQVIDGVEGWENLENPLDVCEDRSTGNIYVSEYGKHAITLLRMIR